IRISQWDIVEFTKSASHVSPEWPAGYWPASDAPPDAAAWDKSVAQVERDRRAMQRLVRDPATDLFARIPHGTGQTPLREALVLRHPPGRARHGVSAARLGCPPHHPVREHAEL